MAWSVVSGGSAAKAVVVRATAGSIEKVVFVNVTSSALGVCRTRMCERDNASDVSALGSQNIPAVAARVAVAFCHCEIFATPVRVNVQVESTVGCARDSGSGIQGELSMPRFIAIAHDRCPCPVRVALPRLSARPTRRSTPMGWQGWSDRERVAWYTASQGSRLVPQAWLDALEQPGDGHGAPFLDPAYIEGFRYLPNPTAGKTSPDPACPFDTSFCRWDLRWIVNPTRRWATRSCNGRPAARATNLGSG